MAAFAQLNSQELEMETDISVIFPAQINPSVTL